MQERVLSELWLSAESNLHTTYLWRGGERWDREKRKRKRKATGLTTLGRHPAVVVSSRPACVQNKKQTNKNNTGRQKQADPWGSLTNQPS